MTGDFSDIPATPSEIKVLPIWDTVKAGCAPVLQDFQTFFNAAWVWTLILTGADLIGTLLTRWTLNPIFSLIISLGAGLVCISAFLVTWHRHVLVSEAPPGPADIRIGPREWRFLLYSLAPSGIALAGTIVMSLLGFIGFPGALVAVLSLALFAGIIAVSVRISLFAPFASLDVPGNLLERSWNLTRGNGFQLFEGMFLIAVAFTVAGMVVGAVMGGLMHGIGIVLAIPVMIVAMGIYLAEAACLAGFLCHAAAFILGWKLPLQRPGPAV